MKPTKKPVRAFVLGGGGARGALQVGALRALLDAGIEPDLLVGTSVGAANATYLAVRGFSQDGLDGLEASWWVAAEANLLPDNYLWLTIRSLFDRAGTEVEHRIRDYFVAQGLDPTLRFGEIQGPRLILVAADLTAGQPLLYGTDPSQLVLEGLLASTAIPPWVRPMAREGHRLMDGGVVSNLPIEPALSQGATEIVALDLTEPRPVGTATRRFGSFLGQLFYTLEQRHTNLEKQLAAAQGVRVHHVHLQPELPMAVWEFHRAVELFEPGYLLMHRYLSAHEELGAPPESGGGPWWRRAWSALTGG
jgi:NTE family protein